MSNHFFCLRYVSIASNSSAVQLLLLVDNTLGELALHRRNTSTNVTTELVRAANVSLSGSGCHHVAVTCHGSTLHVFVEGQFVGQASMGEDVTLNGVLLLSNGYGLNRSSFFEGEVLLDGKMTNVTTELVRASLDFTLTSFPRLGYC